LPTASDIQFQLAAVRQLLGRGAEIAWHRSTFVIVTGTTIIIHIIINIILIVYHDPLTQFTTLSNFKLYFLKFFYNIDTIFGFLISSPNMYFKTFLVSVKLG